MSRPADLYPYAVAFRQLREVTLWAAEVMTPADFGHPGPATWSYAAALALLTLEAIEC